MDIVRAKAYQAFVHAICIDRWGGGGGGGGTIVGPRILHFLLLI